MREKTAHLLIFSSEQQQFSENSVIQVHVPNFRQITETALTTLDSNH